MHASLMTGSMPGMAASTSETCELGSPPNAVEAPEKSFDCEVTWAWTSKPMTISQSPVVPLISFDVFCGAFIGALLDGANSSNVAWRRRLGRSRQKATESWHCRSAGAHVGTRI